MVQIGAFFKNKCKLLLCCDFALHQACFGGKSLFGENLVGGASPPARHFAYTPSAYALALSFIARTGSGQAGSLRLHGQTVQAVCC